MPKTPERMIKYVNGDATQPQGEGKKVICHVCNDINAFGAGFVVALTNRWYDVKRKYHALLSEIPPENRLGIVQYIEVEPNITVANMVAQHDIRPSKDGIPPIRYEVLRNCLQHVNAYCLLHNATIHAPKFGSGLSGGDWTIIEQIIKDEISVDVTIYNFVKKNN